MLKSETRTIGGMEFIVTQMPGRESMRMFARLSKLLGPAIAEAVGSGNVEALLGKKVESLGSAITTLLDDLDVVEFESITEAFAAHTTVKGDGQSKHAPLKDMFDLVFAGKMGVLMSWLGMSITVNYETFLADLQPAPAPGSGSPAAASSTQ